MIDVIPYVDLIGVLGFFLAFLYSIKNYMLTKDVSNYWLVFSVATGSAFVWASMVSLESFGISAQFFDETQQTIAVIKATAFAIAALVTATSMVRPIGRRKKK